MLIKQATKPGKVTMATARSQSNDLSTGVVGVKISEVTVTFPIFS